ncbi:hypothetical protein G7054_g6561 [Neopestalotiopsis clavispora]|nr:hypothetical protein G7054_g6561 [Neopestalotiopsis clavispora]
MSEDDSTPIEQLQLRRARLQRELEYLEMAENVSSLEFKVDNLRKRLGVSPEQLRDCDRPLAAREQPIISSTTVSTEKDPGATLEPLPGAGVQKSSVFCHTQSEAITTPGLTQGAPVINTQSAHSSMPNNAIAPSDDHSATEGQESRMSPLIRNLVTTETFPFLFLALECFKGPVPLDSDEEHFVDMNLGDLQSLAEDMEQSDNNLKVFGYIYYMMFMKTKRIAHLDQAIEKTEKALMSLKSEPVEYWNVLKRLIVMLADGFESAQRGDKLEKAVNYGIEMMSITEGYHVDRQAIIEDVCRIKQRRALENRSQEDFEEAIFEAEMDMQTKNVLDENIDLDQEASRFFKDFEQTNKPEHLDRAIELAENAVTLTGDYNIHKPARLSELSHFLIARFRETTNVDDLKTAIDRGEEAIAAAPLDHPRRGWVLANTVDALGARFYLTGNPEDLRLMNIRAQEATKLLSEKNDPKVWIIMGTLSSCFLDRYQQVKDPEDLTRGIQWIQEALKLDSPNNPVDASVWHTAANAWEFKFWKEKQHGDLEKAIQMCEKSLIAPRDGNQSDKTHFLGHLAAIYAAGFEILGNERYLDLAIAKGKQALQEITTNSSRIARIQSKLALNLSSRFKLAPDPQDLEDAISYAESAVNLSSPGEPNRALWLRNLALCLALRDGDANERVVGLWEKAAQVTTAPPREQLEHAMKAFERLSSLYVGTRASNVFTKAVALLSQIAPRQLAQDDQQSVLERFDTMTTLATSTVLFGAELEGKGGSEEKATEAVRLSELGRGVMTGLRFGMRPDLDALREKHPDLVVQFEKLRDKLESLIQDEPISGSGSGHFALQCETNDRHELSSQLDDVIGKIRLEDGFERFQLPPSDEELRSTASNGPIVVINVCGVRCDALIVRRQSIESLRLRDLQYDDLVQKVEDIKAIRHLHPLSSQKKASLSSILEWLWDVAVGPILEYLGYNDPPGGEWPRVWWIPTGPLSLLPLHAAGYHSSSNKSALDRVISSYSSSIKALQYSRQVSKTNSRLVIDRPALLISMPTTPDQTALRFAGEEVDELDELLRDKIGRSRLSNPTTQEVMDGLANCSIFHFAGHGESHSVNPSKSLLLTNDWNTKPLTVEKLFGLNLGENPPCLAYLSACSTNDNNTEKLHDEAIHLVTACQLAGFQHVVGTMWEVADKYCVDAAKKVYEEILTGYDGTIDGAKIALGVHRAVRHLRDISGGWKTGRDATLEPDPGSINEEAGIQEDQGELQRKARPWASKEKVQTGGNDPLIWAAYIHVGP